MKCEHPHTNKVGEDTAGDVRWCPDCGAVIDSVGIVELPAIVQKLEGAMSTVIQANKMAHVRLLGPMDEMLKAIDTLHEQGWRVTCSGPQVGKNLQVDPSIYELRAEKELGNGDRSSWLHSLRKALP